MKHLTRVALPALLALGLVACDNNGNMSAEKAGSLAARRAAFIRAREDRAG